MRRKNANEKQVSQMINLFWDHWLEDVKKFNDLQQNFEEQSLNVLNNFNKTMKPTANMLEKIEAENTKLTKEANEKLKEGFASVTKKDANSIQANFLTQVKEVNNNTQKLFWHANKVLIDFILTSQEKWSLNIETLLKEQQKSRNEIVKKLIN